jgi:hypothetical protein
MNIIVSASVDRIEYSSYLSIKGGYSTGAALAMSCSNQHQFSSGPPDGAGKPFQVQPPVGKFSQTNRYYYCKYFQPVLILF